MAGRDRGLERREARLVGDSVVQDLQVAGERRLVFLCGRRVSDAMGGCALFELRRSGCLTLAGLPHPSGRSRLWNDPSFPAEVETFVRSCYAAFAQDGRTP